MAATLQQHCARNANTTSRTSNTAASPNPQLKRLVYSKYRELLGSYNDQANAYIDTLPSYMVHKDTGFNLQMKNSDFIINSADQKGTLATNNHQQEMYGAGQRMPAQQTYEAPACVQNAMMTKDKKPFTYTPGGIDLSQIKSERMAKRLARNAQAEGATGIQQQNRPTQPQSPGGSSPSAAASMGAAAMGMPFQVLPPPPPPPAPGKNFNGGCAPTPPPPPPSSANFSNTGTLAPPTNGAGGRGSAPNSPSMPRKSPTPQRFEPPPMGFRPEIKIPSNPMAALRKVPPPVEKNTFWKDEYVKDRSKSPMASSNHTMTNDSVNSASSSPQTTNNGNDNIDGVRNPLPTTTMNNGIQHNQANNNFTNYQQPQEKQQIYTPPSTPQQPQQPSNKLIQESPQYSGPQAALIAQQHATNLQQAPPAQQQQQPSRPEFRSVAAPTSPAVNVYTKQSDSPRTMENATPPKATESPFKFAQQQRATPTVSPLALQSTPSSASSGASVSPNNQTQTVPWRSQRGQSQQPEQAQPFIVAQSHPQPIYNNVQQQSAYQGPKPTNVGSLYIAPLAPPPEPQAQHIVRQQMQQQQQQQRDSPMRQMAPQQQQQQPNQQLRWMSSQPMTKEQPAWARPEENGNVVPSTLNRIKSPPLSSAQAQQQQHMYQPLNQGNGFTIQTSPQNFGAQPTNTTGLRLQINTPVTQSNGQSGPKERIIPIQMEQTPTYTPAQPNFNQQQQYGAGSIPPAPGYVMRTPNQFVDQGYNNFAQQQQQPQPQRVMSPTLQQLNAPRMVQQTQNNVAATGHKTHIIPIAIDNNEGTRGPISKTPIVLQNDQRTPPIQSKSFRILQKITDTIDDGSNDDNASQQQQQQLQQQPVEPQLQRPTFARQMSAQQARHSPTVEQMRRMQIGHEQGNYSAPTTPSAIKYNQQRSFYDNSQQYVPPSEQQVPEPKIYTGSAIPSRSFKILQAMTQPENADEQENWPKNNEMNEIESKPDCNRNFLYASNSSTVEPISSSSATSINSELGLTSTSSPSPYPPYPYPYIYPWYPPPPPPHISSNQTSKNCNPPNWNYSYGMPSAILAPSSPSSSATGEHAIQYHPYHYYFPYFCPPPPHMPPPPTSTQNQNLINTQTTEFDLKTMYPYMTPPHPYLAYPYPVASTCRKGSHATRASSVLPDIIITPSTDDKERPARARSVGRVDHNSLKLKASVDRPMVGSLAQQIENMTTFIKNNLNTKCHAKKSYKKNIAQKSPEENTSPVQITETGKYSDSEETSESESTPKQMQQQGLMPLKSIKSVSNVQIYNGQKLRQIEGKYCSDSESEDDEENETTADGESDIFDEEDEVETRLDFELLEDQEQEDLSDSENSLIDDNLSVIYEEESEMERSSVLAKTVIQGDRSSQSDELPLDKNDTPDDIRHKIEENDDEDDKEDDSTSVTVRLPLKFSFSTSKDAENITTVEVGKSEIEEKKSSTSLNEKYKCFNVATIERDSEDDDDDDEDISVTISITPSSITNSVEAKKESINKADLNRIQDIPLPEEALSNSMASQEDVSVSFSLNMRNQFTKETINGNSTNTRADISEEDIQKATEVPEEMDFFATLMATKMQAQKIKEQSASYWGNSTDSFKQTAVKDSDIKEIPKEKLHKNGKRVEECEKNKLEVKKKCSTKAKIQTTMNANIEETKPSKNVEVSLARKSPEMSKAEITECYETKTEPGTKAKPVEAKDICFKSAEKNKNSKFSFWNHCSTARKEAEVQVNKSEEVLESEDAKSSLISVKLKKQTLVAMNDKDKRKFTEEKAEETETNAFETKPKNEEDIREQSEIFAEKSSTSSEKEYSNTKGTEISRVTNETEEIADIWADRVDDLPTIKPIKRKLKSPETASNSVCFHVTEIEKQSEQKLEKPLQQPEIITKVAFTTNVLRTSIKEVVQPQIACVVCEEEKIAQSLVHQQEESAEVDFWAQIENARECKTPGPGLNSTTANDATFINSFGEQDISMYGDDMPTTTPEFDPLKYPEQPREVDTDEEIDFWAEIEAKRQAEEDDVTFHKSASFWASRERHNTIEETPYKPMLPKAFHANLPNEPPNENINIWQTLKAHIGEEPLIIDPEVEEENSLVREYDEMMKTKTPEENHIDDTVSVHEPIVASVWCPQPQTDQEEPKSAFGEQEKQNLEILNHISNESSVTKPELAELEEKRNNYKKAMAFFNTSIDENKEQSVERYERYKNKANRASYIEEESEQWDWDAVNEALEQEKASKTSEITEEIAVQESFIQEQTTQIALSSTNSREDAILPEVYEEPTVKSLPELEVNKFNGDRKISVKDRISAFEIGAVEKPGIEAPKNVIKKQSLSVESSTRQSSLSRNSSTQRSESEIDEDDSGVTDMNKQLSGTDTESESFPELRKMSSYQRASTHSRLFKLLQEDAAMADNNNNTVDEFQFKPSRKKIVHNVSITRKQNPTALAEAETMSQRRERLSLPLHKNISIDNDNPSTPNSPASPTMERTANKSTVVSDKLVSELVQSLLLKSESTQFRKLPMEKLQAAAKRVLEEELETLGDATMESTPASTSIETKKHKSYADYYNTWSDALGSDEIVPSKSFKALQDSRRNSWTARCPRVLSSKTINRDLARVTESPEIFMHKSKSPECFRQSREASIGKWKNA